MTAKGLKDTDPKARVYQEYRDCTPGLMKG